MTTNNLTEPRLLLTKAEARAMLRIGLSTITKLIDSGVFVAITSAGYRAMGSRVRVRAKEVEWYIQGGADFVRKNREAEQQASKTSTATPAPETPKKRRGGRKRKPLRP